MERQYSRERIRRRRRKRLLRRIVIFIYRCICLGLTAAVIIGGINVYQRLFEKNTKELSLEEYPQSLVTLLEKNPETENFVINYPQNKDKDYDIDLSDEVIQGTIPLFLQWDERWGYEEYGSAFLAVTGCGPTCLFYGKMRFEWGYGMEPFTGGKYG